MLGDVEAASTFDLNLRTKKVISLQHARAVGDESGFKFLKSGPHTATITETADLPRRFAKIYTFRHSVGMQD